MESYLKEHNISARKKKKKEFFIILKANIIFSNNLMNNVEKKLQNFRKTNLKCNSVRALNNLGNFWYFAWFILWSVNSNGHCRTSIEIRGSSTRDFGS